MNETMKVRKAMKTTKNVLVCEDDPVQLKILTTLIDQAGYRPITARTPSEAVMAARRCGVDAVLTDVQLQDGNAFDLVGDLRAIGFDAPVFMASAYATDGMKDRARSAGVKRFFDKPFDLRQIKEQVELALNVEPKLDATVLIVDGHDKVRAGLEKIAAAAGFDVLAAADGAKALEILQERGVDILLADLHAHGSDGARLIRKALDLRPDLHVVMMSGDASREEIRAGYEAGAVSLVRKPVPADRLQAFLKASLKAARASRETAQARRERQERLSGESVARRLLRWIKSYLHAPSRSRKGGQRITLTLTATALTVGVITAAGIQGAYEASDRIEAMADRAMVMAAREESPSARREALLGRAQTGEQLRLMSEANEVTRRYYEGHLQEMKWQRIQPVTPAAPIVSAPIPEHTQTPKR